MGSGFHRRKRKTRTKTGSQGGINFLFLHYEPRTQRAEEERNGEEELTTMDTGCDVVTSSHSSIQDYDIKIFLTKNGQQQKRTMTKIIDYTRCLCEVPGHSICRLFFLYGGTNDNHVEKPENKIKTNAMN